MTMFGLSLTYGLSRQSVFLNGSRNAAMDCMDWWSGGLDLSAGDVEPGIIK